MSRAGLYQRRVRFEARANDANGDPLGAWAENCTVSARITGLPGLETVMAARLQGKQPVTIKVRANVLTRLIDNTFRAIDARSPIDKPVVWDIAGAFLSEDRSEVIITATQQVGQTAG